MTAWQALLAESFSGTDPGADPDVSVQSGEERMRLRVKGGRLELVDAEEGREPDLAIRLHAFTLEEALLGKAATCDIFRDAEVSAGNGWSPALPAAELDLPSSDGFERIPGASISVAVLVTSTIFGEVGIQERWQDGALVSSELMPMSQLAETSSDVRMMCSLAELGALRRGELTPLDALAGGVGILGDWPHLMCFAELVQHLAYQRVWEEDSALEAQAAWGAVFCSSAYGEAAMRAKGDSVVAS